MAVDRQLPVSTTPGAVTGNDYMDAVQEEMTGLWDRSICQLTSVSGTNTISANCDPPLTAGLVDGMRFMLVPANTTTLTTVTLNIQALGGKNVVDSRGLAPAVGALIANAKYLLEWDAGGNAFFILTYLPPSGFDDRPSWRNIMMDNGSFKIWQRGSSVSIGGVSPANAYSADRWYLITNSNQACTVARGSFADRSQYDGNVTRNSGQTGIGTLTFAYPLTAEEIHRLFSAKCTLSFRTICGANFSPTSGTVTYKFSVGQGAEGKRSAGFSTEVDVISGTVNVTTSAQTVTATSAAVVPNTSTQGEVRFTWTPTGTAGADDRVAFDSVQLESGETATQFEYAPFAVCLQLCQRHYAKTFPYATAPAQNAGLTSALSSMSMGAFGSQVGVIAAAAAASFTVTPWGIHVHWQFPVRMRTTPTIVTYNPSAGATTFRLPTGNGGAAMNSAAVTVSAHTTTGDRGVTVSCDNNSETFSGAPVMAQTLAYIHIAASAEL